MFTLLQYRSFIHCLVALLPVVQAVLVNVTVDDAFPDPLTGLSISYLPQDGQWNDGKNCTVCDALPDPQRMNNGTWHDNTYFPSPQVFGSHNVSFSFNGSAIYAFCAISLSIVFPQGYSNMTFYIDEEFVGSFQYMPPGTPEYDYNVSVYSNSSLPPGPHMFKMENGQFDGSGSVALMLFDYLVYSYDDGRNPLDTTLIPAPAITNPATVPSSGPSVTPITSSDLTRSDLSSPVTSSIPTSALKPSGSYQSLPASNTPTAPSSGGSAFDTPSDNSESVRIIVGVILGVVGVVAIIVLVVSFLPLHRKQGASTRAHRLRVLLSLGSSSQNLIPHPFVINDEAVGREIKRNALTTPYQEPVSKRIIPENANRQEGSRPPAYDQVFNRFRHIAVRKHP